MAESSSNQATALQNIVDMVDFVALRRHGVDIVDYIMMQELDRYFGMLNGLSYKELVKEFWVRAEVYDKKAVKYEEFEKIAGDPSMKVKTRAEMGLEEFTRT